MAKAIELRQRAADDITAIVEYHLLDGGEALAARFIDSLEAAFTHLGKHPLTGSLRFAYEVDLPEIRCWPLKRFPYLVFYRDTEKYVDVWRVLHARQDIPHWLAEP